MSATREVPPMQCRECEQPMRPQRSFDDGRITHHARGLCRRCYATARREGTLDDYVPNHARREQVVEDVDWMHETREHPLRWAPRLGMTHAALSRMLYRAGRRKLAHAIDRAINEDRRAAA